MAEQKILSEYLNGMGKAKLKNIKFNDDFTTLALAETDISMVARGTFCQVGSIIYYRQTAGQPLKAVIDEPTLNTILTTLQSNINNQIAQSKAFTPFDASVVGATLPNGGKNGQGYYVTGSGTVAGMVFTANDVFFAKQDNPTTIAHFGDIVPIASIGTSGVYGVVKIATTLAEYNAGITDNNLSISAPVIKALLDTINATLSSINEVISVLNTRTTTIEDRLNKKFCVELTDAAGVCTQTYYSGLQAAIDFADAQTVTNNQTVTNKRILVRQDCKITATTKLKSSIVIDFTGHDLYAVSDITLFDDALMTPNNGGHVELIGIKDLVVAIQDTTGSTNAIMKMTGSGTNRRYRIHAENIFTAISIFRTGNIATTGVATAMDVISENVIDCYSTAGATVSNYNDKYGAMAAHHSNRLFEIGSAVVRIDCVVTKHTRCMGLINNVGGAAETSYLYMECPSIVVTTNYLVSGTSLDCTFHAKNYIVIYGMSLTKITANGLILNMKSSCVYQMALPGDVVGNIALYHTTSDGILNTNAAFSTGIPIIHWIGSCVLSGYSGKYYTFPAPVECRIQGVLCSNMEINASVLGGSLIVDLNSFNILTNVLARRG